MMVTYQAGILLSFWALISLSEVKCTFPDLWNLLAPPSTTHPTTPSPPSTKKPVEDDIKYFFKGVKFHPTESYPYPTPPAGDHGFEKWEQEQDKKYASEILSKLVTPNDTKLQVQAKSLIANFLVNAAMDDLTAVHPLNTTVPEEAYYPYPEELQPTLFPTQSPQGDYELLPVGQEIYEPEQFIQEQQPPAPPGGQAPFNPVQSIIGVFSRPSQPKTTPDPNASTEYYIVPINPITEPNAISKQQANIGGQFVRLRENVAKGNITGVVDESLRIASVQTIGVFVSGFLNLLLCNPVDRWNGRCDE